MQDQQLSAAPFNLDAEARAWVDATVARLSPDDRLRQLFVLRSVGTDPGLLARQQAFGRCGFGPAHAAARRYCVHAASVGVVPAPGSRGRRKWPSTTSAGSVKQSLIQGMYSSTSHAGCA